jgi:hypothetical protein
MPPYASIDTVLRRLFRSIKPNRREELQRAIGIDGSCTRRELSSRILSILKKSSKYEQGRILDELVGYLWVVDLAAACESLGLNADGSREDLFNRIMNRAFGTNRVSKMNDSSGVSRVQVPHGHTGMSSGHMEDEVLFKLFRSIKQNRHEELRNVIGFDGARTQDEIATRILTILKVSSNDEKDRVLNELAGYLRIAYLVEACVSLGLSSEGSREELFNRVMNRTFGLHGHTNKGPLGDTMRSGPRDSLTSGLARCQLCVLNRLGLHTEKMDQFNFRMFDGGFLRILFSRGEPEEDGASYTFYVTNEPCYSPDGNNYHLLICGDDNRVLVLPNKIFEDTSAKFVHRSQKIRVVVLSIGNSAKLWIQDGPIIDAAQYLNNYAIISLPDSSGGLIPSSVRDDEHGDLIKNGDHEGPDEAQRDLVEYRDGNASGGSGSLEAEDGITIREIERLIEISRSLRDNLQDDAIDFLGQPSAVPRDSRTGKLREYHFRRRERRPVSERRASEESSPRDYALLSPSLMTESAIDPIPDFVAELDSSTLLHAAIKSKRKGVLGLLQADRLVLLARTRQCGARLSKSERTEMNQLLNEAIQKGLARTSCTGDRCSMCEELRLAIPAEAPVESALVIGHGSG